MTDTPFDFDTEGVMDQVWKDLQKQVPTLIIRQTVIKKADSMRYYRF